MDRYILLGIKDGIIVGLYVGNFDEIAAQKSRYDSVASSCNIKLRIEKIADDEIGDFPSTSLLTKTYSHLLDIEE